MTQESEARDAWEKQQEEQRQKDAAGRETWLQQEDAKWLERERKRNSFEQLDAYWKRQEKLQG